ncbi:sclerostin domain-containing protein 1a isoform X2 [Trichomycterus rosablanca]|uniref:sclerostin domain-containing protein 1a isoform X2 n=1 Tax=Trichomycterus rosablanca TaxID=2290929 RepID=UPI002F35B158
MRTNTSDSRNLLVLLLCVLLMTCAGMKNDATEIVYPHIAESPAENPADDAAQNRARTGGGTPGAGVSSENTARERAGPMGCRELRSTKYISDGQCTSINPIKELVCAGECLPAQVLPNWIGGYTRKQRSRRGSHDWRCVNDKTRTERIQLLCQDGSTRTYKITVVTGCKCKRYLRQHNESAKKSESIAQLPQTHRSKSKRKHRNSKVNGNWHELES